MTDALADTSIFVALETGRELDTAALPDSLWASIITIGELKAGALAADDVRTRARRWETVERAIRRAPLPVDEAVADQWARLRAQLAESDRRMPINDSWIAATALAHGMPIVTQDDDYDVVEGLTVIKV
ncbi:MAG: hypothetical protein QOI47_1862 [Actinomycetota bacterium]|jgi:predicted nucleic acid-binding protein|nr:hypothetical protein [Actinomycetota bacterium]